jgi:dGTPase
MTTKAARVIRELFEAFNEDPRLLPEEAQRKASEMRVGSGARGQARAVADYIAGMTDRYALKEHERIYSPGELT